MSIAGELNITMRYTSNRTHDQIATQIVSTRPLQASNIFTGKSITQTLTTISLLFNICSKAQAATAVRAIESATQSSVSSQIESAREALITLENLREQTFRTIMDWPTYINESAENQLLSHVSLGIKQLMQALEPSKTLAYQGTPSQLVNNESRAIGSKEQWIAFSKTLSKSIFGSSTQEWLENIRQEEPLEQERIESWASKQQTQAARFIYWLNQKKWRHAGESNIAHVPDINDDDLLGLLRKQDQNSTTQAFKAQPSWNNQCYELSWFSRRQLVKANQQTSNGIYSRMVTRLKEMADLIAKLDTFFIQNRDLKSIKSSAKGMAHSEAARGRLTHYVEVEGETIKKLVILAPTEWNFHPDGVAVKSLNNLEASTINELRQQAELLIHAIDPCVGYQLQIAG